MAKLTDEQKMDLLEGWEQEKAKDGGMDAKEFCAKHGIKHTSYLGAWRANLVGSSPARGGSGVVDLNFEIGDIDDLDASVFEKSMYHGRFGELCKKVVEVALAIQPGQYIGIPTVVRGTPMSRKEVTAMKASIHHLVQKRGLGLSLRYNETERKVYMIRKSDAQRLEDDKRKLEGSIR